MASGAVKPEQHQTGLEHPPVAGQIADPAAGQQQGAIGERVIARPWRRPAAGQ